MNKRKANFLKYITATIICACVFSVPYIVNSFSESACLEKTSNIISSLAKQTTTGSMNFNAKCNSIDPDISNIQEAVSFSLNANYQKTTGSLYNFRVAYDANIEQIITLDDIDNIPVSLLLHNDSGRPHKNTKEENIHASYEIALMFDSDEGKYNFINGTASNVHIRESTARLILEKKGIHNPSKENFKQLIDQEYLNATYIYNNKKIPLRYGISNIILDNKYYDEFFYKTFGCYLTICSTYKTFLPYYSGYSVNFDFGTSVYDSTNYVSLIKKRYPSSDFDYVVNTHNFTVIDKSLERTVAELSSSFASEPSLSKNLVDVLNITLVIFCLIIYYVIFYFRNKRKRFNFYVDLIVIGTGFSIGYLIFFLVDKISKNLSNYFIFSSIMTSFIMFVTTSIFGYLLKSIFTKKDILSFDDQMFEVSI